ALHVLGCAVKLATVRFVPKSGHETGATSCPRSASNGLMEITRPIKLTSSSACFSDKSGSSRAILRWPRDERFGLQGPRKHIAEYYDGHVLRFVGGQSRAAQRQCPDDMLVNGSSAVSTSSEAACPILQSWSQEPV